MKYKQEVKDKTFNTICKEISKGRSLRNVLRDNTDLPNMTTIFEWLALSKEYHKQYAGACEERAIQMFEDMFEIADETQNDWTDKINGRGEVVGRKPDNEAIQRSKLRVDTRKWALSKMFPKKYGERIEIETTGEGVEAANALAGLSPEAIIKIKKIIEEDKLKD